MKYYKILFTSFLIVITSLIINQNVTGNPASLAFQVIPTAYASTTGTGTFLGPMSNSQRTYQFLIRDTELTGVLGQDIRAISLRLPASAGSNWPVTSVTYTNFDIYLSESVAPENRSLTFANNVVGVQKRVRFGSLIFGAGAFPSGGSPNAFGSEIGFDSGYVYTGGHLLIEIRHTGFTGTSQSADAILTSTGGYGTLFSACWTGSYTGTAGSQANFCVVRLSHQTPLGVINQTEIANNYSLSQNYPNPFNPNTNINFELNKAGNVTLKVYDVSGREIKDLIQNKNFIAGNYTYNFNAADLKSGVYFYTLLIDNLIIDTKKMVLVK